MGLAGYHVANPGINIGTDEFMDYFIFGLQLRWNLFDGFKNRQQRAILENQIQKMKNEESKYFKNWNIMLADSRSKIERTDQKIAAVKLSKDAAEELVKTVETSLHNGTATPDDYLEALNSLRQTDLRLQQVLLQRRVAILKSLYISGKEILF